MSEYSKSFMWKSNVNNGAPVLNAIKSKSLTSLTVYTCSTCILSQRQDLYSNIVLFVLQGEKFI
jgi:hypothetical protein